MFAVIFAEPIGRDGRAPARWGTRGMYRFRYRVSATVKLGIAALAGALVSAPVAVVIAAHQFSDVPNNHPFHKEIDVVADAGIARGFSDGTYRPGSDVTRQAMAAFLARAVGRAGWRSGTQWIGNDPGRPSRVVVTEVGMKGGAVGAGSSGFVMLSATVEAWTSTPAACPCTVYVRLRADGGDALGSGLSVTLPADADASGESRALGSISSLASIYGDESHNYQLVALTEDTDVGTITLRGQVSALYVPLGPDGDATSSYEHTCGTSESEPNDTRETATWFGGGGCRYGSFSPAADQDHYSIAVASGQTLTVETKSVDGSGCAGSMDLTLMNDSGTVIDGRGGACARMESTGLPPGTYYIRAAASWEEDSFDYRITATLAPAG